MGVLAQGLLLPLPSIRQDVRCLVVLVWKATLCYSIPFYAPHRVTKPPRKLAPRAGDYPPKRLVKSTIYSLPQSLIRLLDSGGLFLHCKVPWEFDNPGGSYTGPSAH